MQARCISLTLGIRPTRPWREGFRAQQMLALYRSGRQPEALRAFRRFRAALGTELGLETSPWLMDLEAQMLRQDPSLDALRVAPRSRPRPPLQRQTRSGRSATCPWP